MGRACPSMSSGGAEFGSPALIAGEVALRWRFVEFSSTKPSSLTCLSVALHLAPTHTLYENVTPGGVHSQLLYTPTLPSYTLFSEIAPVGIRGACSQLL